METPNENLKGIIRDIQSNKIMLPDFQRQFNWDIQKQISLVASVLTMLPVGSILLLKADSNDYKSKKIGLDSKEKISGTIPEKTNFLLDGQQRMTCLTNVFSDVIHESSGYKVSKLSSRAILANRFYLRIEKWSEGLSASSDPFCIRSLDFSFNVSINENPDFLTADIKDFIECRQFFATDYDEKKPYVPGQKYTEKLDEYCLNGAGDSYLIPLFLLIGSNASDDRLRLKRLNAIIKGMTNEIREAICTCHRNKNTMDEKEAFAFTVLFDGSDKKEYSSSDNKDEDFEEIVDGKADVWEAYFRDYLNACVEKIKLTKIEMPEGSRARAIDIYENMNMGGLSLSTLDLVAARVAKVSYDSLYDRILKTLKSNNSYSEEMIPSGLKAYMPKNYNASTQIKAIDNNRVVSACSTLFLEVLGLYCNNSDYDPDNVKGIYSKSGEILKLSENDINSNCEKVCTAIDRTFAFLQLRCGVRSISDVNYKIMMRIIAYIFTFDEWYSSKKVINILEAWYWSAIFSGEYDKDQNDRYEDNLRNLLTSLRTGDYSWIESLKNGIMNTPYFSDCSFLLMEKASEGRLPKDHLGKYVCQFFLSRPYIDLINDDRKISVFSEKLERHHIIPLGSVSKISESSEKLRNNKENILNSPVNFIYISDETNKAISDDSLEKYEKDITAQAKDTLKIPEYPKADELNDSSKVKSWLAQRHQSLEGAIKNRIDTLLGE